MAAAVRENRSRMKITTMVFHRDPEEDSKKENFIRDSGGPEANDSRLIQEALSIHINILRCVMEKIILKALPDVRKGFIDDPGRS